MIKLLKYYITPLLVVIIATQFILGGHYLWFGAIFLSVIMILGDAILPKDFSIVEFSRNKFFFNLPLWLSFPLLSLLVIQLIISTNSNYYFFDYVGGVIGVGLIVAGYGTNSAHELIHRSDSFSINLGRLILSLSLNPDFSIEHVYGHHERVGTKFDPASAYRGENVYKFIFRSTIYGTKSAWNLENNRLIKKSIPIISLKNLMIQGYLMIVIWICLAYSIAGIKGVTVFLAQGAFAKIILEIVNYMEHYGLVRKEGQDVSIEHSWNSNSMMSSLILYSLTRHSHHHQNGSLPYWELKPYKEAPEMPYGYLSTIFICLIPPLWFKVINPLLIDWDKKYA